MIKASEVLKVAENEVGYIGKKNGSDLDSKTANVIGKYTKYARDLAEAGYYQSSKQGADYCAVFVDWCIYIAAGRNVSKAFACKPTSIYGAGVYWAFKEYRDNNMTIDAPVPGAQIFFYDETGELAHTGLVYSVDGDTITTVEGNVNCAVVSRTFPINDKSIAGYGMPKYEESNIAVGDIVRLKAGAHCYTAGGIDLGYSFSSWVYEAELKVGEISGSVAHVSTDFDLKAYTGWAALSDCIKVNVDPEPEPKKIEITEEQLNGIINTLDEILDYVTQAQDKAEALAEYVNGLKEG